MIERTFHHRHNGKPCGQSNGHEHQYRESPPDGFQPRHATPGHKVGGSKPKKPKEPKQ